MQINILWDKLQVPMDEREDFFERSTQTLGPSAVKSVILAVCRLLSLLELT